MIEAIEVKARYERSKEVPKIGQRKRMRVNGRFQLMTLNSLTVHREGEWDEDKSRANYYFEFEVLKV